MITGIIVSILMGCLAGFVAGKIMRGGGFGFIVNSVLGIIGGVVGTFLLGLLNITWGGFIGQLGSAILGAIVILALASLFQGKVKKSKD
ncbi:MAG: GlsB/YeaQ/YmgE family stress response membrane protein [Proteobacteria bacterium]|nr:GlsB/YeaQ/YmgE family stress response membrane protein [Pseudomonadota bacterium]